MKPQDQRFPVCMVCALVHCQCPFRLVSKLGRCVLGARRCWLSRGGAVLGSKATTWLWQKIWPWFCPCSSGWGVESWPGALGLSEGRSTPWVPCLCRLPKQSKGGLATGFIWTQIPVGSLLSCSAATNNQTHVACRIHHGTFYFDWMLSSVLWLRAVLAAGFVPNKQHGSFVMEKWHMLGFFLTQQTSGESWKPLGKLFKLMWIETLLPRRKNGLRNAVKSFVQAYEK